MIPLLLDNLYVVAHTWDSQLSMNDIENIHTSKDDAHLFLDNLSGNIENGNIKNIYSVRPLRDVILSLKYSDKI